MTLVSRDRQGAVFSFRSLTVAAHQRISLAALEEAATAGGMHPGFLGARRRSMPLLDHFHPPLSATRKWEGISQPLDQLARRAAQRRVAPAPSLRRAAGVARPHRSGRCHRSAPRQWGRVRSGLCLGGRRGDAGRAGLVAASPFAGDGRRVRRRVHGARHQHRGWPDARGGDRTGQPQQQGTPRRAPGLRHEVSELPQRRHRPDLRGCRDGTPRQPARPDGSS